MFLPLLVCSGASGITLVNDNFNDGDLATVGGGDIGSGHVVLNNGTKNTVETTLASLTTGTGAWVRSELHSNDEIAIMAYPLVQVSWTLQNANVARTDATTNPPSRIQLAMLPSTVAQGSGAEMYLNTQGGIWFDMNLNTGGVVTYQIRDANDTKTVNGDATLRSGAAVAGWDGVSERTFTLALDALGYTWSDSAGNDYGGGTFAAAGLDTELALNWWGFHMGQNRGNIGNGTHELTNFSVEAVPEPSSLLLVLGAASAGLLGRRRSCC